MATIAFIDTEIEPKSKKILDIGCVMDDGRTFHNPSVPAFTSFVQSSSFICGHNILNHDLKYLSSALQNAGLTAVGIIDTLYLSPLLFPTRPYHALLKDDKLQTDELNNPLNDSIKAKDLFNDEVAAFLQADDDLKEIFYLLLNDTKEFTSFFSYLSYSCSNQDVAQLIRRKFKHEFCVAAHLSRMIMQQPIALAYCLSLMDSFLKDRKIKSITPAWVLRNYPDVERIMMRLRNTPCLEGCEYCNNALDAHKGLKNFFGFDSYRVYDGEALQEKAVNAALNNKSILAVFPTGGGKSITFQVPALMSGENARGLTVVISPLQSLMKDQVDNLEKLGITEAVTINGMLDPIERAKSFERVEDGSASLLYISPESLRSKTIERLILGRKIVRFVIDEAHCFSSWGQDFRVDYLYIGDFIRSIEQKKNLPENIPVSCFTATAKQKVIEDIRDYFREKLSLELTVFSSKASRTNLHYKVFEKGNEEDKYQATRDLIDEKNCPTIIYVSRTLRAFQLAERLNADGFNAKPYHGKMDSQEKIANQNAFLSGEVPIMVATSAFGMGVDKKDVGMVIHYDISDSLENYVQEAGRAGRDENISADCFVLYNEEDLSKHFILLNQTKLSIKEIQQIWKAIKDITRFRSTISNSALEIARKAGWDDNVMEIETRVTTAIAALEDAGYLKRGQNMPHIFANSIMAKNAQEAIDKINASERFEQNQKEKAVRIIKKLFSSKSRKKNDDDVGESRVDYISDHLGIVRADVIKILSILREEKILADDKDLTAFIKRGDNKNRSLNIAESYLKIEKFLLPRISEEEQVLQIKELNEIAESAGYTEVDVHKIKTILNFWAIKNWVKRKNLESSKNHVAIISLFNSEILKEKLEKRYKLSIFIVGYLYQKVSQISQMNDLSSEEVLVEFSVHELKSEYEKGLSLFETFVVSVDDIEDTLFYLSRIEALKIEGGFLVVYNKLTIERLEKDNKIRYKAEDYNKLEQFYSNKIQQIHIVGEYAKKMVTDYKDALQFVEDYFHLNYQSFLNKYFKGSRQSEIKQNVTPAKFKQLFGELSATQLKIIKDNESKSIAVAAGPGSGKTRVLVHKLASLLLMEDVKHEQLLMLTFSRAATTEFKKRLLKLIGNAAYFIEIKTFHSYCFDLLGKVGSLEKSDVILARTIEKIKSRDVEMSRVTKTVLVIDEAQDMNQDEYNLVVALMEQNEDIRVIAVGDDDQNIYEFRGANSKYLEQFIRENHAVKYELIENYRSKSNLVDFSNQFATSITHRLKSVPIIATQTDNGTIKIVRYQNGNLIIPVISDILNTDLKGTTCVLTKTNEQALQITGLLLKNKIPAKLIQSNDRFNLYDLAEIRFFYNLLNLNSGVYIITNDIWEDAKRDLKNKFTNSSMIEVCNNLIRQFEETNTVRKYKSDFEVFLRESKIDDFYKADGETIFVSTIHKAKGKEFDNVFIMLENFDATTDECKRQLYVAITRAKQHLTIHTNSDLFRNISVENLVYIEDNNKYSPPNEIVMHLTHKEIWLDYFITRQHLISQMASGTSLIIQNDGCANSSGQCVLKFSKLFLTKVEELKLKNYKLSSAKVNFIVFWSKEGENEEVKIILPELQFVKIIE